MQYYSREIGFEQIEKMGEYVEQHSDALNNLEGCDNCTHMKLQLKLNSEGYNEIESCARRVTNVGLPITRYCGDYEPGPVRHRVIEWDITRSLKSNVYIPSNPARRHSSSGIHAVTESQYNKIRKAVSKGSSKYRDSEKLKTVFTYEITERVIRKNRRGQGRTEEEIVYIGTTNNPERRAMEHEAKGTLTDSGRLSVTCYEPMSRAEAEQKEAQDLAAYFAQHGKYPKYNKTTNGQWVDKTTA